MAFTTPISVHLVGLGRVGRSVARAMLQDARGLVTLTVVEDTSGAFRVDPSTPDATNRAISSKETGIPLAESGLAPWLDAAGGARPDLFVDLTASDRTHARICESLADGIGVVLANKIPISGQSERFHAILEAARTGTAALRASATVGAGLPLMDTLVHNARAGVCPDRITASMSGTLTYLLDGLRTGKHLDDHLAEAVLKGIAEPDPSVDIEGCDVLRKATILARLSGFEDQVLEREPFADTGNVRSAGEAIRREQTEAEGAGRSYLYLAELTARGIRVGFRRVNTDSDHARASGEENVFVIEPGPGVAPVSIRGPGAGITPTARAVLRDIFAVAAGDPGHLPLM